MACFILLTLAVNKIRQSSNRTRFNMGLGKEGKLCPKHPTGEIIEGRNDMPRAVMEFRGPAAQEHRGVSRPVMANTL